MIGLSSRVFDPDGAIYLYREQIDRSTIGALYDRSRRVTKYKTLDGGVSVVDGGYAVGDRSMVLAIARATPEQAATIVALAESYAQLVLTTPDGAFIVSPEMVRADGTSIKITLSFISEV